MLSAATADVASKEKFRVDYAPAPYRIDSLSLNFDIHEEETLVTSKLTIIPAGQQTSLDLDGEDLELRSIELDGMPLAEGTDYELTTDGLSVLHPPEGDEPFQLTTVVSIAPHKNTQLSGLYKSSGMFVTQCEAEGFRRITYFQDRPDVMATYEVRVEADASKYPLLLSNGNEVGKGDASGGRHWASFVDPFRKPSYLFALVAGDLGGIEGTFTTSSGREVRLALWSEHENVDQLDWALSSLKQSMAWDEETYGREYDLDVYHIVAVNDFNMGAMENKGLNVFNTAAVLAKPSTATDADFERVRGIVAHEYFHNWSGNRVTCRDWFQLTLKEGLTVFRDQHFSQDMTSAAVRRIEEARIIRTAQFMQDAGPMAHPIRPESYIAMDNFYTVTVYNKGAEVIRMYKTLMGAAKFREGMDLYFERHDGQAVTCDDFRAAMADASGRDFTQFERWYLQAGTPTVTVSSAYDAEAQRYTLTLAQSTPATPGQAEKLPFHIPVEVRLLDADGVPLSPPTLLELTEAEQDFTFDNVPTPPLPSVLRGFSAPVKLQMETSDQDLAILAANDDDAFNRWDAAQRLYKKKILDLIAQIQSGVEEASLPPVDPAVLSVFRSSLVDPSLDPALRAYALAMPDFTTLSQEMSIIDPEAICTALRHTRRGLAGTLRSELQGVYDTLSSTEPYAINEEQVNKRMLRNAVLGYLAKNGDEDAQEVCINQFREAVCMTDSIAALSALAPMACEARMEALDTFYQRAKANRETLVINKWLAVQASADTPDSLETVRALMTHEGYDASNPNSIRSLISTFANANPAAFHAIDGSGYAFIADQVIWRYAPEICIWRYPRRQQPSPSTLTFNPHLPPSPSPSKLTITFHPHLQSSPSPSSNACALHCRPGHRAGSAQPPGRRAALLRLQLVAEVCARPTGADARGAGAHPERGAV